MRHQAFQLARGQFEVDGHQIFCRGDDPGKQAVPAGLRRRLPAGYEQIVGRAASTSQIRRRVARFGSRSPVA
jgi:hypothetical protein